MASRQTPAWATRGHARLRTICSHRYHTRRGLTQRCSAAGIASAVPGESRSAHEALPHRSWLLARSSQSQRSWPPVAAAGPAGGAGTASMRVRRGSAPDTGNMQILAAYGTGPRPSGREVRQPPVSRQDLRRPVCRRGDVSVRPPWPPGRTAQKIVGAAHEVAVEAGRRYGRTARAAAGGRATRFGPAADDDHARPEGPGSVLHPGRVRERGKGACARARPAPPGGAAGPSGDAGRQARGPAGVHRSGRCGEWTGWRARSFKQGAGVRTRPRTRQTTWL